MRFVPLDKLINLHDGYRKSFRIDYHQLLLLQVEGQHFLIEAVCPHQEHPLSEAWVGENCIECPLHGYRFALNSGDLVYASEEPCRGLKTWQVAYEGAEVGVAWEES